jgi:hypothetical protein
MTTGSLSSRSPSPKGRPASSGTPSTKKKCDVTMRIRAWGGSSPSAGAQPSAVRVASGPKTIRLPDRRQGRGAADTIPLESPVLTQTSPFHQDETWRDR